MISEITQWKPDDMDATAIHFNELANKREDTMAAMKAADTAVWNGQGGEGKDITLAKHAATTSEDAAMFRATALVATEGRQALYGLQQQLVNTLEMAKDSAWQVDDSGQVSDTLQDPWERAARQPIGAALQSTIVTQAAAFQSQQTATAAGLAPEDFTTGGQCNDPDYQGSIERRFVASVITGILLGELAGGPPGALTGGALAGIGDLLHETSGDGPKCQ